MDGARRLRHGSQVRLALAYREGYPDEVAEAIAQNRRTREEWHELYPFIEFSTAT